MREIFLNSMGGYGAYVWSAYALGFLILGLQVIGLKHQASSLRKKLSQWFKN